MEKFSAKEMIERILWDMEVAMSRMREVISAEDFEWEQHTAAIRKTAVDLINQSESEKL